MLYALTLPLAHLIIAELVLSLPGGQKLPSVCNCIIHRVFDLFPDRAVW